MSASRAFIDVLVGKLTAYVDAPSRPAPSILTPAWVGSLAAVPFTHRFASHAYAVQACSDSLGPATWCEPPAEPAVDDRADAPVDATDRTLRATPTARRAAPGMRIRTPAERMAIELLRRLGATSLTSRATDEEIRAAWRRLLHTCHPDAHPHAGDADRAALTARLRAVLRARDILEPRTVEHDAAA